MNPSTRVAALVMSTLYAVCHGTLAAAADRGALTVTLENDTFTGSDNNYTNGVAATWVSGAIGSSGADGFVDKWGRVFEFLPFIADEGFTTYASWTVVQEMHTPDDIQNPNPPAEEQPYAGILYVDSVLYARSARLAVGWELKLGLVGPASQADNTQRKVHNVIGADRPMGWGTQLQNEPIINAGLTAAYLLARGEAGRSAQWRLVPVGNLSAGTYFTGLGLGMYGEFGWNLVDALGGTSLRDGLTAASTVGVGRVRGWSISTFVGIGGHAVAHYLPLDGNVFRNGRSVDTRALVGNASVGIALRHGGFTFSAATTFSTRAFETQKQSAEFGTVSISWRL
jgi:hypothetical protein